MLGPASANKQSMSRERQRGLRGSLANLSLTSLERARERQTGFISLFLIPLTRITCPTVILCAGFVYSQEATETNKQINNSRKIRACMSKNLSTTFFSVTSEKTNHLRLWSLFYCSYICEVL